MYCESRLEVIKTKKINNLAVCRAMSVIFKKEVVRFLFCNTRALFCKSNFANLNKQCKLDINKNISGITNQKSIRCILDLVKNIESAILFMI